MNVIEKVIRNIKREIPRQVLEVCFFGRIGRNNRFNGDLDWEIRNNIIDGWVREDCDLIGAIEDKIPMALCEVEQDGQYRTIIRIPKHLTEGRVVTEVLSFDYLNSYVTGLISNGYSASNFNRQYNGSSPFMNQAGKILAAASPAQVTGTTATRVIGENVILINDYMGQVRNGSMMVRLTSDEELTHIKPATIPQFSELCLHAAKAYIYVNTVIDMDMGQLYGGMDVGTIKTIIEGFADANELYKTYFKEEWQAVSFMNDDNRHGSHLRTLIGGQA